MAAIYGEVKTEIKFEKESINTNKKSIISTLLEALLPSQNVLQNMKQKMVALHL